jgi:hypothetical protein
MDSSPEFIEKLYSHIDFFGAIGKLQGIIASDTKLREFSLMIYDRLSKKNPRIQLYSSMAYQFQELAYMIESNSSKLSLKLQELQLASEILQEFKLIAQSFKNNRASCPSFIHFHAVFQELCWFTNSATQPYKDDYEFDDSMTQFINSLNTKIELNQHSYHQMAYFLGGLLNPCVFSIQNLSSLFSDNHCTDLKALFKEFCEKEWNLITDFKSSKEFGSERLPTDHKFTLEDEVCFRKNLNTRWTYIGKKRMYINHRIENFFGEKMKLNFHDYLFWRANC